MLIHFLYEQMMVNWNKNLDIFEMLDIWFQLNAYYLNNYLYNLLH